MSLAAHHLPVSLNQKGHPPTMQVVAVSRQVSFCCALQTCDGGPLAALGRALEGSCKGRNAVVVMKPATRFASVKMPFRRYGVTSSRLERERCSSMFSAGGGGTLGFACRALLRPSSWTAGDILETAGPQQPGLPFQPCDRCFSTALRPLLAQLSQGLASDNLCLQSYDLTMK